MHRTLLIGLDGATFTVLEPLMQAGDLPFLKKFIDNGVRANLMSTAHPLTPPAWTSIMTGRTPGHHGVFDFIWAEERKADHYFTLYNFRDIRCETIWQIVSRQGGSACTLNYPLMSPPPEISGYIVPGFVSWRHLRRHVHPPELYDRMKAIPGFNARELAWDFELEKKAETGVPKEEYGEWVRFHMDRERQWFEVIKDLMTNDPSDLTAILFDGPDKIMHMGYRFIDPAVFPENPEPWEVEIRDEILAYFREMDRFIGDIVEMAGEDARTFMVSDHGFGPSTEVFRVNTWLAENGYLKWLDLDSLDEEERRRAEKVADGHFVVLDWDETLAYARTATSNGIYVRVAKGPEDSGVAPDQYDAFCDHLAAELLEVRHPRDGREAGQGGAEEGRRVPGSVQHPGRGPHPGDARSRLHLDQGQEAVLLRAPARRGNALPGGHFSRRRQGHPQGRDAPGHGDHRGRSEPSLQRGPADPVRFRGRGSEGGLRGVLAERDAGHHR